MRLIDAEALKQHYAWWGYTESGKKDKELFDTIVDLQPTVGEWINVKEKLPELEEDVLLFFRQNAVVGFRLSTGWFSYSGDGYYTDCDFSSDPDSSAMPTHWMPLPAPPEVT